MPKTPRIPASLASLAHPIGDLTPYHRNPRIGDVPAIAASLEHHGQYRPIVVNKGTLTGRPNEIIAGNHTVAAALTLGWKEVAVTWLDVDNATAAKIVVVDNRTNQLGGYDAELLAEILDDLPDLEGTGYDRGTLDDLLDATSLPAPIELPTMGKDTGAAAVVDYLQWGYLQWSSKRTRLTSDEVEAFDRLYKEYVDANQGDLGFGWHILQVAHEHLKAANDTPSAGSEPAEATA
ncbi:ParB N-terminal domain-containing protein [Embleya sp. NPDC059237]|uniref:ParB N-terminal domain-containing protein n=1 Tax=Embleya sp. NPDC059237 TaxID=3346784 RepID=UPI003676D05C